MNSSLTFTFVALLVKSPDLEKKEKRGEKEWGWALILILFCLGQEAFSFIYGPPNHNNSHRKALYIIR